MRNNPYTTKEGWDFCNSADTTEDLKFRTRDAFSVMFHSSTDRSERIYVIKRASEFLRASTIGRVRHLKAQSKEFQLVNASLIARISVPYLDIGAPDEGGFKSFSFFIIDGGAIERDPILQYTTTGEIHGTNLPIRRSMVIEHLNIDDEADAYHGSLYSIVFDYNADKDYRTSDRHIDQVGFDIELNVFLTYNFGEKGAKFTINPDFYEV